MPTVYGTIGFGDICRLNLDFFGKGSKKGSWKSYLLLGGHMFCLTWRGELKKGKDQKKATAKRRVINS